MYWDWNSPYLRKGKDRWKFNNLCKRLNGEGRNPSPREWDMLIDYMYPEEDRILERLDKEPVPINDEMVSVFNYTYHHIESGRKEDCFLEVPLSEKEDYQ